MSAAPKNLIVGTAGHIDHGKSSLVLALTGTDPDRLEEEKRRGITIDLGFAFLEEAGIRFGFVDVPGHERFVRNMLAGAAGIDLVLFVVAADESIRPQTREHFEICRLLGVQRGVIALTKSDLVDPARIEAVRRELGELFRGSFLEKAAMIPVSAKARAGLEDLKRALAEATSSMPARDPARYFRLPIDRSFSMKGFGTVVTGTLISGSVAPGDEVELFPTGGRLRVRGVHCAGAAVDRALPGQRTAINLAGIDHSAIRRGMTLATPGFFRTTRRFDATIELLPAARKMKDWAQVHLHHGTSQVTAEVHLIDSAELAPGQKAFAQIRVPDEMLVLQGDRFVLRQFSPVVTIGGGMVLDPFAKRPRRREPSRVPYLETLERGRAAEILPALAARTPQGLLLSDVLARTAWLEKEIESASASLVAAGALRRVSAQPAVVMARPVFDRLCEAILTRVAKFHQENPLVPGIPRGDLRSREGRRVRPEVFRAALEELVTQRKLELAGEVVKRAGSSIALLLEEARAKDQIEAAFARAGLAVPAVKDVLASLSIDSRRAEKLLQILLREQRLVRVTVDLVFHRDALADLRQRLRAFQKSKGPRITVPGFKELTGISRKYAIPLLEYLDRQGATRRAGDERVIL